MAIISDYDDQPSSPSKSRPKLQPNPTKPISKPTINQNPFTFWFYFTIIVSIITFFFISISSLAQPDPKTWFLNLPTNLRTYYSLGRILKVQINPNEPQVDVFTYSKGVRSNENVVVIHGLGCSSFSFKGVVDGLAEKGLFGVGIDLPGSGFSEKAVEREEERVLDGNSGFFSRVSEVYEEIKEKGIFWGFDNLVEHGHLPYDELNKPKSRVLKNKVVVPLGLGANEVGRVLGQVVEAMGLAPFHLVLHDSALVMSANWVVENSGLVRSVTLIDSLPKEVALPLWVLEVPLVREVVSRVDFAFGKLIGLCCSRSDSGSSLEAHRVLLNGREAIVGMGKKLNHSFDLGEWVSMDGVKGIPMQVLWSGSWSEEWSEEGKRVAEIVSPGKLIRHSGGRWPQEDTSSEVAENIISFVSSLPKTERKVNDEPMRDEAKAGGHHDDHGHDGHSHHDGLHQYGHDHGHAGYMDAYGLGHGYGM